MCGIVGIVCNKDATAYLLEGLKMLEYRGYDSAGIAIFNGQDIDMIRTAGKIRSLEEKLRGKDLAGTCGIAHTRWATHGAPNEENAHPHFDYTDTFCLVHNGIIENYMELKEELKREGIEFRSETDTEVISHLIGRYYEGDFLEAVKKTLIRLKGSFALAITSKRDPNVLIAARNMSPLVVGHSEFGTFVASDVTAFLKYTRRVTYLDDNQIAVVESEEENGSEAKVRYYSQKTDGETVTWVETKKPPIEVTWTLAQAEKGGYPHFMLKEINEQPTAVTDSLRGRISPDETDVIIDGFEELFDEKVKSVSVVACGTSWHAGLIGKFLIEELARIPVAVDYSSEFRYRRPILDDSVLTIAISQSGETADTMAAVREAKQNGSKILAISNVVGSSIPRLANLNVYTQAGPEISVASTKAFTSQISVLALLAVKIGLLRGKIGAEEAMEILGELRRIPTKIYHILEKAEEYEELARLYYDKDDFLYLGRGINYPVALEGALKLKELSYIHAEGYPAGEMKHGPIALIELRVPTVVLAVRSRTFEKTISNVQEVMARKGEVILLSDDPSTLDLLPDGEKRLILIPGTNEILSPLLTVLPLQLLAYYIAVQRGCDVDQPRNLAKSVVVE